MAAWTLEDFIKNVNEIYYSSHNDWRWGQVLFNVLSDMDYELAEMIRGTSADPFHAEGPADKRSIQFMNTVFGRGK